MKKIVAMLFAVMSVSVLADTWTDPNTGITWKYTINNGEASIGGETSSSPAVPTTTTGAITIPSILGGCPVTSIQIGAFSVDCSSLTSVTIPSSVTSIGLGAFVDCSSLTSVTILEGVTSIGSEAFSGCSSLASVMIPSSVTSIGIFAFDGCSGLKTVYVSSGDANRVKGLMTKTGIGVNALEFMEFKSDGGPYTQEVDGIVFTYMVKNCKASVGGGSYLLPAVPTATKGAITIPSSLGGYPVTSINEDAFYNCSALISVIIPTSVTSIGDYAFFGCSGLKTVCVSFGDTERVKGLMMGKGIDVNALNFEELKKPDGGPYTEEVDGVVWTYMVKNGEASVGGTGLSPAVPAATKGAITIPSFLGGCPVTSIGEYAFFGCNSLTSVTIPPSVTSIGSSVFRGCISLTSVTIPSSVTSIGNLAFFDCSGLETVYVSFGDTGRVKGLMTGKGVDVNTLNFVEIKPDGGPYTEEVDGIEWTYMVANGEASVGGGTYDLTAISKSTIGEITIPSTLGGCLVTGIGDYAFFDCGELTSVTIPSSVTRIGDWAFGYCYGLGSVEIPSSVTSIGDWAFNGCYELTSVTIPSSVTSIGKGAFNECRGVVSVTISEGVTSIGEAAFWGCSMTSVAIPASVTSIGEDAFMCCAGLTNIDVDPANGHYCSIDGVLYDKDVTELIRCPSVKALVTIPSSVISIGKAALWGCSMTSIEIPSGVTSIGVGAFCWCEGLTSIVIPPSVTSIGEGAFEECSGLKTVYVQEGDTDRVKGLMANSGFDVDTLEFVEPMPNGGPYTEVVDGIEWTYMVKNGEASVGGGTSSSPAVPTTTEGEITIPSTLGRRLVTGIGDYAFYGCSGLTSVTIPSSVTSIGEGAFRGCSGLTSVTIPSSVTSIGYTAFSGCSGFTSFVVEEDNPEYSARNNMLCSKDGKTLIAGVNGDVVIPDCVTIIGDYAFFGCGELTSVTIPTSVTSIGDSAFYDCSGLTSVTIPTSVMSIGVCAFYGCSGLTSITIPSSVTSIGGYAFFGCSGLERVYVQPGDVKRVKGLMTGKGKDVDTLEFVELKNPDGGPYKQDVDGVEWTYMVANGEASVGGGAFDSHAIDQFTYYGPITIPSSLGGCPVTSIGAGAFADCGGIRWMTIPSGITSIGASAFKGCSGLISVTIPTSVTSIGAGAFEGCGILETVYVRSGDVDRVKALMTGKGVDVEALEFMEDFTITCATTDDGNCNFGDDKAKFCLQPSDGLPAGTEVKINQITIAQAPSGDNDNVQKIKFTIDGVDYVSEVVDKSQGNWNWAGNNRVKRVYVFTDGPTIEVGRRYGSAVTWLNGSNDSVTPRFCATQDTNRFFGASATGGRYTPASILDVTKVGALECITITCATTNDGNCNFGDNKAKFCLQPSDELPAGTEVRINQITIAQSKDNNDDVKKIKLTIDGVDYVSETVDKSQGNWTWTGEARVKRIYAFTDGPTVVVGKAYDSAVTWLNGSNESVTPRFCATQDSNRFFGASATGGRYTPASILEGTIVSTAKVYEGTISGNQIEWDVEPPIGGGSQCIVRLTVEGENTWTIDKQTTFASVVLTGDEMAKLTIAGAELLSVESFSLDDFAGSITHIYDVTNGFVADEPLLGRIAGAVGNEKFVFNGEGEHGAALAFGQTPDPIKCHLVFNGGKHTMDYRRGNGQSQPFGQNGSLENPTILVKSGTTLDFTAKDISYWGGDVDVGGVVRVNDGGTLNLLQNGSDTMFYRQRLCIDPGALVTFNCAAKNQGAGMESSFRWHGGAVKGSEQIYVPASDTDMTGKPAIIRQLGVGGFHLAMDETIGCAMYVGKNSKLVFDCDFTEAANNSAVLVKYGEGEFEIAEGRTITADFNAQEGIVSLADEARFRHFTASDEVAYSYARPAAEDVTGRIRELVGVPFLGVDGQAVTLDGFVETSDLTEGDQIFIYDKATKGYFAYALGDDDPVKKWHAMKTISASGDVISGTSAPDASTVRLPVGTAVWLERADATKPIRFIGIPFEGELDLGLEVGNNLVSAPGIEPFNLANIAGNAEGDRIVLPRIGQEPKIFTRGASGWSYLENKIITIGEEMIAVPTKVTDPDLMTIPAGTGFWYEKKAAL